MGALIWDERLIGQAEAYELANAQAWRVGIRREIAYIDCCACGQAILVLGAASNPFPTTSDALVAAILRHGVTAHDLILNRKNRGQQNGPDRGGRGDPAGGDRRAETGPYATAGRHSRSDGRGREPMGDESASGGGRPGRHRGAGDAGGVQ